MSGALRLSRGLLFRQSFRSRLDAYEICIVGPVYLTRMSVRLAVWLLLFSYCNYEADCSTTLDRSETLCPDDDAVYYCSIQGGTVMTWQITSTCGSLDYRTSFSSTSSVGQTRDDTLCSTTLMFTVTSLTSSSISVTLTIHTPVLLNGTIITCSGQSQALKLLPYDLYSLEYIDFFPISTVSYDVIFGKIEWESIPFAFVEDIQPPPLCGPTNKSNSSVMVLLERNGNLAYNISIIQRDCSQEAATFFILHCPLLLNFPAKKFTIYTNGTMTAFSNDTEVIACNNTIWPIAMKPSGNESEGGKYDSPSSNNCDIFSNSKVLHYFTTGIIGASLVSVIITLITTSVIYKLREICKKNLDAFNKTANTNSDVCLDTTSQLTREPIYDDIELADKTNTMDVSKNIAYVVTKN